MRRLEKAWEVKTSRGRYKVERVFYIDKEGEMERIFELTSPDGHFIRRNTFDECKIRIEESLGEFYPELKIKELPLVVTDSIKILEKAWERELNDVR